MSKLANEFVDELICLFANSLDEQIWKLANAQVSTVNYSVIIVVWD